VKRQLAGLGWFVPALAARGGSPLLRIARPYAKLLPLIGILGVLAALAEGVGVTLLIPLVSVLLGGSLPSVVPGPFMELIRNIRQLPPEMLIATLGAAMVLLIVTKGVVQAANSILTANVDGRLGRDIRDALCRRMLQLDYAFFLSNDNARLVQIVSTDCWYAQEAVRAIVSTISGAVAIGVISLFLLWIDWRLSAIVALGAIVIQGVVVILQRKQRQLGFDTVASNHALGERMLTVVSAIRAIRVFGQQQREQERFAAASERVRRNLFRTQRVMTSVGPLVEVLVSVLFVVVLLAAYALHASLAATTAFLVLLARLQPHAHSISRAGSEVASYSGSISEVEWLLRQEPARESRSGTVRAPALDKAVTFENVSYAYPDGTIALQNVTAAIEPGTTTAVVGKSGAGKSSFVDLLCRLAEPQSGSILFGSVPLSSIDPQCWRSRIAISGQNVDLVDGTIAENIAYGHPMATAQEVEEAAAAANAGAFILQLPNGYETRLGFDGLKLSGGQRQRIGLARALLRRPDILILDEATSAVDVFSERKLRETLQEKRWFRTAIVISHRLSTLAACDHGIVLEHGRVVEAGPLESLSYFDQMALVSDG
jgi:subfamily B ATP-binding cassette protein MsbA